MGGGWVGQQLTGTPFNNRHRFGVVASRAVRPDFDWGNRAVASACRIVPLQMEPGTCTGQRRNPLHYLGFFPYRIATKVRICVPADGSVQRCAHRTGETELRNELQWVALSPVEPEMICASYYRPGTPRLGTASWSFYKLLLPSLGVDTLDFALPVLFLARVIGVHGSKDIVQGFCLDFRQLRLEAKCLKITAVDWLIDTAQH